MTGPVRARPRLVQPPSEVDGGWVAVLEFEVSPREPVFAGHYPDLPIFPGVCLVECVHLAVRQVVPDSPAGLVAVDSIRFHAPVFPGDVLTISLRWDRCGCEARVDTIRGTAAVVRLGLVPRLPACTASSTLSSAPRGTGAEERGMIDAGQLKRLLPHRYPMLLVDRAMWTDGGTRLVVLKAVSCNEPWYDGIADDEDHACPGTLLVESWMQAAGVVLSLTADLDVPRDHVMLAGKLSGLEFRRRVVPGDVLHHDVRVVRMVPGTVIVAGETRVDGEVVLSLERVVLAFRPAGRLPVAVRTS